MAERDDDKYIDEFIDTFLLMRLQLRMVVAMFMTEPPLAQAKDEIKEVSDLLSLIPKTLKRAEKFTRKENT